MDFAFGASIAGDSPTPSGSCPRTLTSGFSEKAGFFHLLLVIWYPPCGHSKPVIKLVLRTVWVEVKRLTGKGCGGGGPLFKNRTWPRLMVHACNPSIWEAEIEV